MTNKITCPHCGDESFGGLCFVCKPLAIDARIAKRGFPKSKDAPGYKYAMEKRVNDAGKAFDSAYRRWRLEDDCKLRERARVAMIAARDVYDKAREAFSAEIGVKQ